jgi:hypothetical protein
MTYESKDNPRVIEDDGDQFVVYENLIIIDGQVLGGFYDTHYDAVLAAYRTMCNLELHDFDPEGSIPEPDAIAEYFKDRDDVAYADVAERRVVYE